MGRNQSRRWSTLDPSLPGTLIGRFSGQEFMMYPFLQKLWNDESGQDLAEYALLLALISVAAVFAITALGDAIRPSFEDATEALEGP
jgi:Flp pilus assembly pilin Flp